MNHYRQVATLAAQTQQQHTTGAPSRRSSAGLNGSQDQSQQSQGSQSHPSLTIDVVESLAKAAVVAAAAASAAGQQVNDQSSGVKSRSPDSLHHPHHQQQQQSHLITSQLRPGSQSVAQTQSQHHHHQQQSSNSTGFVRTRIRTSFDPELELPKLHKWFAENQHPSRAQIHHYVSELNSLESRRGRKPLDSNNVVYWFKNARAAHKRQELKLVNGWTDNTSNASSSITSPHKSTAVVPSISRHQQNRLSSQSGHHQQSLQSSDSKSQSEQMSGSASGNAAENGADEEEEEEDEDSMQDEEGDGSDDRLPASDDDHEDAESDSSSAFPRTLDLSMRPVKRRRTSHSGETITADHHPDSRIKDEACSEADEDEEEEEDEYYYSPTHQQQQHQVHGAYFAATNGGSALLQHNGHNNNSHPFHHSGTALGPNNCSNGGSMHHNHPDSPDNGSDGRRVRRSRTFIDPMSEVPRLEQWFTVNTHPTHSQIVRYTEELNRLQYRQKFPKLEPKNIQFWFKNRRAKYKRLSLPPNPSLNPFSSNNNNNNSTSHPNNNNTSIVNNGPTNGCTSLSPNSSAGLLLAAAAASSLITSTSSSSPLHPSPGPTASSSSPVSLTTTTTSSGGTNSIKHSPQSITPILTSALNIERLISN